LPRLLFSARSLGLFGRIPAEGLRSYLSGLLIGAEIAAAQEALAELGATQRSLTLVGAPRLAALYGTALGARGWMTRSAGEAATVRGLALLAARIAEEQR
jgi:2-dehydro-3-deoxygalactonokinase